MAKPSTEELNNAMDIFMDNIQKLNNTIYLNRAFLSQRQTTFDDTKFLLDLFELIAHSRFSDAYHKIQFMREYLIKYIPKPILYFLNEKGKEDAWGD